MVKAGESDRGIAMFSKTFNNPTNPSSDFAAVMVCSDAEQACPFVPGAEKRISMPYEDPGDFDGTCLESVKYDERCMQIANELNYLFSYVSKQVHR